MAVKLDRASLIVGLLLNFSSLYSLQLDSRGRAYFACLSAIYIGGLMMAWRHPRAHSLQRQQWATVQVRDGGVCG